MNITLTLNGRETFGNMRVTQLQPIFAHVKSFYGKATVFSSEDTGYIVLKSYDTLVCALDEDNITLYDTYSKTTLRHIREFLKQNERRIKGKYNNLVTSDYKLSELKKIIKENNDKEEEGRR